MKYYIGRNIGKDEHGYYITFIEWVRVQNEAVNYEIEVA